MNDDADAETHAFWAPDDQTIVPEPLPAPPPKAGPQASEEAIARLEHYTVLTREDGTAWELGRGAMGVTYKAFDTRLHCPVALKVIHADLLEKRPILRERFLREARVAASVRHPNIASVFHLGEAADGHCFYAMELIQGETLAELVRRCGPLPATAALDIAIQVTQALVAAGQADLVHRDLKPANIMLSAAGAGTNRPGSEHRPGSSFGFNPGTGEMLENGASVKVIDFGLARSIHIDVDQEPLTVIGDFLGTPQYASPEQLSRDEDPIDIRSDIFSLGSTLWFLLTGRHPFAGRSLEEIFRQQLRTLPHAQLQAVNVPEPLMKVLCSMLAFDPAERPQSPPALLETLRRCREQISTSSSAAATDLPVPFAPPRPRSRKMAPLAAAGAALALAVCGLVGWHWYSQPAAPVSPTPAAPAAPEKSIAVLPFENLSAEKDNAFFADGVQDEILTDLSKVADLKVISRTSVAQYKSGASRNLREIAAQLGVAHVVEGSVQRSGNKVRVTAQLINARTDTHLWAEHYDRDLSDIFTIQSEIAQAIADQLRAHLSAQEKAAINAPLTVDLPAYDLYLRARVLYAESSVAFIHEKLPQAARLLDAALARDPKFLAAWCLLARVHGDRYFGGDDHTPERLEQASAAVQAAVRLAPDAGETHLALADYHYHAFRDYTRARAELDLARRTLPNNPEVYEYTGYIDRRQGRWNEANRNAQRALELDPRNFSTLQQMAMTYQLLHRYNESDQAYARALEIVPSDPGGRIFRAFLGIDAHADVQPFQATLSALLAEDPRVASDVDNPLYSLCERTPEAAARTIAHLPRDGTGYAGAVYPNAYWEGFVARQQGDAARARDAFTRARADVQKVVTAQPNLAPAISILGMIDAGLGRKAEAIAEGRQASELLPTSKDTLDGTVIAANLAQILAWTGEKAAAIDQLIAIEKEPNLLTYGLLKLHPQWDDLRGEPRFEALVASLAKDPGY